MIGGGPRPTIAVVVFPGSNDNGDAVLALEDLGADAVSVWHGETELWLPHGCLVARHVSGEGLDARRLAQAPVRDRSRVGGERLQLAANRPRRSLRK